MCFDLLDVMPVLKRLWMGERKSLICWNVFIKHSSRSSSARMLGNFRCGSKLNFIFQLIMSASFSSNTFRLQNYSVQWNKVFSFHYSFCKQLHNGNFRVEGKIFLLEIQEHLCYESPRKRSHFSGAILIKLNADAVLRVVFN